MMKNGEKISCPSCGASSFSKDVEKSTVECEYCGSVLSIEYDSSIEVQKTKQTKLTLLLLSLPVMVIALAIVFWVVFQNIREHPDVNSFNALTTENNEIKSVPPKDSTQLDAIQSSPSALKNQIAILSHVNGETSNGGLFWVFQIENKGPEAVARPGVMVSLFDGEGKRVVEQGGWATRSYLTADESTTVLTFVKESPNEISETQFSAMGGKPYGGDQQKALAVSDYTVNEKNNRFEIVGDVFNNNQVNAKYTHVVAVALNENGVPVGIGHAYATEKDLPPNQKSGFNVSVGTFLVEEPVKWDIWAVASF